ncbi:dihydrolipoamide acetyltransferase family protein [Bacillus marinisedimentorum]|uniref:dihydrolipoamide acetyltransferase family protein n=1 Tax=Bacillus marinisedimentorum TaxID=1821260 RepID=UPI0008729654|nr:dihydrolipoamide acetyltransferase family protein [Bacillus marinisedimentorum]
MVEVKLTDIGEGMTEGEVISYFVKVGDEVAADQPLLEIQTDKMTAEIPAPAAGKIRDILIEPQSTVKVGTPLLILDTGVAEKPAPEKREAGQGKTGHMTVSIKRSQPGRRVLAAPFTRKIARDNGIDIENVEGTGTGGRVTDDDVYRWIADHAGKETEDGVSEGPALKENAPESENVPSPAGKPETETLNMVVEEQKAPEQQTIPFRGRRKQIARKMAKSLYTIPHVTNFEEADVTDIQELREEWKKHGKRISMTAVFVKAAAIALKDFPVFNARLDEEHEQIILENQYHIGVAVDTEDGLIVPVIKHADRKSLSAIHTELKALVEKARNNKLNMTEMTGSTFTISNVGQTGSTGATPIINYPETGLAAFHKTKRRPVVNDSDEIVIRSMMNVSMSFDHRVADGAAAVAFTNRLVELIEHPNLMMLEMV